MTSAEATTRALDFLCLRLRASVKLIPVDSLPAPVYAFDTSGWRLFAVVDIANSRLTGTRYVAVHEDTGQVRDLGFVG